VTVSSSRRALLHEISLYIQFSRNTFMNVQREIERGGVGAITGISASRLEIVLYVSYSHGFVLISLLEGSRTSVNVVVNSGENTANIFSSQFWQLNTPTHNIVSEHCIVFLLLPFLLEHRASVKHQFLNLG
jgi:hypothetical protein